MYLSHMMSISFWKDTFYSESVFFTYLGTTFSVLLIFSISLFFRGERSGTLPSFRLLLSFQLWLFFYRSISLTSFSYWLFFLAVLMLGEAS